MLCKNLHFNAAVTVFKLMTIDTVQFAALDYGYKFRFN